MEPSTLLPTSAAEKYHILRVDYHIMCGKGKCVNMKPAEWGLDNVNGKCPPMHTVLVQGHEVAPDFRNLG